MFSWIIFIKTFALAFIFIGLKAFQQINVVAGYKKMVLPTSLTMAFFELYAYGTVILNGLGWYVLAFGFGAGLGSIASMCIQDKLKERGFYASRGH